MDEHELLGGKKPLPGKRMTLAQCRKVAPELKDLSDEQLMEVRDLLDEYVEIIFEAWQEKKHGSKHPVGYLTDGTEGANV